MKRFKTQALAVVKAASKLYSRKSKHDDNLELINVGFHTVSFIYLILVSRADILWKLHENRY